MLRTYWYDTVDPFRELTSLQQWMDQTLQATLNSFAQTPQLASSTAFVPRAEVFETDDQVALKVEVPGLSEKDFEITLKEHVLTVRGERKLENGFKQENLTWTERPYGTFIRTFNLPQTVDVNTINAPTPMASCRSCLRNVRQRNRNRFLSTLRKRNYRFRLRHSPVSCSSPGVAL